MILTPLALTGSAIAQSNDPGSPRQIIDALIAEREVSPMVAPQASGEIQTVPNRVGMPAAAVDIDPAVVGVLPGAPLPRLRREGEFILERPGQLINVPNTGYWVFVFDETPGEPDLRPMIVQRCQRLASMQDTIEQRRDPDRTMSFSISGQVHTYRGVNYLLPTAIAGTRQLPPGISTAAEADEAAASAPAAPAVDPFDDIDRPAVVVTDPQTPGSFGGDGDPIALMEQMLDVRETPPTRPDTMPTHTGLDDASLDAALQGVKPVNDDPEKLVREGAYLVNRAGRITRGLGGAVGGEAQNLMFAFEADGQDPESAEPPMMLMPCKLLELMEDSVAERGDQVVFVVSGRV
ncbi:MAG: hypothetical protein AAGL98_04955, partial [Planctomycetota bacterium]